MVLESIRTFNQAVPFQRYEIRMASGEKHRVPHPDFVFVSPKGSYVIVVDSRERPHHLSTRLIEEAVLENRRGARHTRRDRS